MSSRRGESADPLEAMGWLAASVAGRGVGVHRDHRGEPLVWSDGRDIHLGASSGEHARFGVLIQAALIRAGSLDPGLCLRLVGRPLAARRYLALEARRATVLSADRLPRRLLDHPALTPLGVRSVSSEASLTVALSREPVREPDGLLGVLRPGAILRLVSTPGARLAVSSGKATPRLEPELDDEAASEQSNILKRLSSLAGVANPLSDLFRTILGAGTQPGGDGDNLSGAAEALSNGGQRRRAAATALVSHGRRTMGDPPPGSSLSGLHRYPEWDARTQRYRPAYTRVQDFEPWDENGRLDLGDALTPPSRAMRRQLAGLALGFKPHPHHRAGEEIVTDDLVRLVTDLRAGHGGDARIYRALEKIRRDLGVLILIDSSASVRDLAADGSSLQHHQIALAWRIARALEAIGDRVAVYGFNSWGRERVHLLRVKGYEGRIDGAATERLARLAPVGFTRIGAAVRHAGAVIERQAGTPYRLVLLITDGLSYDDGYEASYAEADTRHAIAELRARRIGCLCLSVGADADAGRLRRLFGEAAFLRTDTAEEAERYVGKLLTAAVAAVHRR